VFNLLPGQGLGFTASKEIAFGLGTPFVTIVIEVIKAEVLRLLSYIGKTLNLTSKVGG
jgi:hypothetical protein